MKRPPPRARMVPAPAAERDFDGIINWSVKNFGAAAAKRYSSLLLRALDDIAADPLRTESNEREDLAPGVRLYHLSMSRTSALRGGAVHQPRHFVVYRLRPPNIIDVVRILHDARNLPSALADT